MTIFARRSIQRILEGLAGTLTEPQLTAMVSRLNRNNTQSLAAEWELLVLYRLSHLGSIVYEAPLRGPARADVIFQAKHDPAIQFAADITCISDRGLEDANPIMELIELIQKRAQKLGLLSGGFQHRVGGNIVGEFGKHKVCLSLPPRNRLHAFFERQIAPQLKALAKAPLTPWALHIRDDSYDIEISYESGGRYSNASYPAFRNATAVDRNPLYNRLDEKRQQLRGTGYGGPKGIIVCDGGCQILTSSATNRDSFSKVQIIREFFKRHKSISFVVLLWIHRPFPGLGIPQPHEMHFELGINPWTDTPLSEPLQDLLRRLPERWPPPIQNGENARLELEGLGYKNAQPFWGHSFWGGYQMSTHRNMLTFRMSARSLIEILAGQRTQRDFDEGHGFTTTDRPALPNPFAQAIARGFTVSAVSLEKVPDQDDDWIEFQMAGPDSAIAPFRAPKIPPPDSGSE
jgi:hypothetical protein